MKLSEIVNRQDAIHRMTPGEVAARKRELLRQAEEVKAKNA